MKKFLSITFVFAFIATLLAASASASIPNLLNLKSIDKIVDISNIPEISGDFAIRGRQDLRVRVFVHGPKAGNHTQQATSLICEDSRSGAVVGGAGWKLTTSAPVKYKLNQSSAPSSVRSSVPTFVSTSFNKWTAAITLDGTTSAKPNLAYDGLTSVSRSRFDSQNIIAWGRTNRSTLGATYIWYYTATGIVAEVDTIMNNRISWNLTCSTGYYNAENIMIHELGHWFGLDDEYDSPYVENTMFGYGSKGEIKKISPEQGDIDGLNIIY